jgi:hypothetical protein
MKWFKKQEQKKEITIQEIVKEVNRQIEVDNYVIKGTIEEIDKVKDNRRLEWYEKWKEMNPFKHEIGFKVLQWVVFRREHYIGWWSGYGWNYLVNYNPYNKYDIINFNTGELKNVDEKFIDDLVTANNAIK